ncbi:MAG: LysR family transcriptional regulator, partial [Novosphingobium sp.]
MRFKGLDLNLLVAFDVLLDECNVSRAAERLHLSQPAVSAALRRLRDFFNDPLLALHGKRMVPTPHAVALRPQIKQLLADVEGVIGRSTLFDPATSDRWFRICVSDYLSTVLFSELISALRAKAPHIRLDLQQPSEEMPVRLDRGEIDLVLTPDQHCTLSHPSELLFEER